MMELARCRGLVTSLSERASTEPSCRFVLTSTQEMKERQAKESLDVNKEMENLNKKLHYLETTYNNAQRHLEQIFKGGS